jgi:hypothetical protein
MKPYIIYRLAAGIINNYSDEIKKIIINIEEFLGVLTQSYRDLDEIRTSELQLIELR